MTNEKSEKATSVTGIVKALQEFQQACPAIKKDSTAVGTKYTYKYGSLPHVLEVIKPHMKKAGLTFTQPINFLEGQEFICTTLYHVTTGERIESLMLLPNFEFSNMNPIQSKGSVITYFRRYALMALLGIVAEEDDNDAQGEGKKKSAYASQKADEKPWLNPTTKGMVNVTWKKAVSYLAKDGTLEQIKAKYRISKTNEELLKNEALTFVEPSDVPEGDIGPGQSNINFEKQGPSGKDFPEGFDATESDIY